MADLNKNRNTIWFLIVLLTSSLTLSGCIADTSTGFENVVSYITTDYRSDGKFTATVVNDNGRFQKSFHLKADVSYEYFDYEDEVLFSYGPGGLIMSDGKTGNVELLSLKDTSHVFKNRNSYGWIENCGFTEQGYQSVLYPDLGSEKSIIIPYPVSQVAYYQGSIWITNAPGYVENYENRYLVQYSEEGEFLDRIETEPDFGISVINNEMYFIKNDGIYQEGNKVLNCSPYSPYDTLLFMNGSVYDLYNDWETSDLILNDEIIFKRCFWFHPISDTSITARFDHDFYIIDFERGSMIQVFNNPNESLSSFYRIYPFALTT